MSMSDCDLCWNTHCCCGWNYRNWKLTNLLQFKHMIQVVIDYKMNIPDDKIDDEDFKQYIGSHI